MAPRLRQGVGMDRLREFLDTVRSQGAAAGRFRGLLHVLIGRRVATADGTLITSGMTWRDAAAALKKYRWDREAVRELGLDPATLPPRDREKFWYTAINRAGLGTPEATAEAEALVSALQGLGYVVG
ncbi:MAG: hypothetical protein U0797_18680 [Gemmataceae bacterium]